MFLKIWKIICCYVCRIEARALEQVRKMFWSLVWSLLMLRIIWGKLKILNPQFKRIWKMLLIRLVRKFRMKMKKKRKKMRKIRMKKVMKKMKKMKKRMKKMKKQVKKKKNHLKKKMKNPFIKIVIVLTTLI